MLLADERCVLSTDDDSNLGSILSNFTNAVPIPKSHVYGIDEALLSESTDAVATAYENKVLKPLLEKCGGMLDCVVLVSDDISMNAFSSSMLDVPIASISLTHIPYS